MSGARTRPSLRIAGAHAPLLGKARGGQWRRTARTAPLPPASPLTGLNGERLAARAQPTGIGDGRAKGGRQGCIGKGSVDRAR